MTFAQALAGAYGLIKMTGLSFLIGFLFVVFLHLTKMFFLRSQHLFERLFYGGWDRVVGYSSTAFFSVALAAFGLYCLSTGAVPPVTTNENRLDRPIGSATLGAPAGGPSPTVSGAFDKHPLAQKPDQQSLRFNLIDPETREKELDDKRPGAAPEMAEAAASLPGFISDTLIEQRATALGCWIIPGIFELVILVLVLHNRPRYLPYHFME
ncbi:MAG: hypothetical protein JST85_22500 [Acidobacteria bacterium]|nr:hypothetical protein [Acidobacteriota bacterium]